MFNLIRKDFLLILSSKSTSLIFLILLPFYQFALGSDKTFPIPLMVIVTFGYMLTTMSFAFEVKNKPYVVIRSLPIKAKDIVIAKYVQIFINYIIAVIYTFMYIKILNFIGFTITGNLDIYTLKESFILIILALSVSLPLQFKLPAKIANYLNIFIYIFLMNYFSIIIGDTLLQDLSVSIIFLLLATPLSVSMGISTLLYKSRDLS